MAKVISRENRTQGDKVKKKATVIMCLVSLGCLVVLFLTSSFNKFEYANDVMFPLWYVALGIGVIVSGTVTLKFVLKPCGVKQSIGIFLIGAFLLFWISGLIFGHLNHVLDSSEPVCYVAVIEKKDYDNNRRAPDTHEFRLTVNGDSFYIDVPSGQYYSLDVGDLYVVEYHKGFFNEPYYIGIGEASGEVLRPTLTPEDR